MPSRPPGTPDVDLTFDGASGTINGAVFMTGVYQQASDQLFTFLEIRHNGVEQGYNTDGALQQDQRDVQNSTHSILLAEVPIVIGDGSNGTIEGVAYREFRLNLAEAGNTKQYLSLDALQIWQEEAGNLTNFTSGSGFAGAHTNYLAYDLDAGGDRWIGLKEGANGNGASQTEFTFLIPDSYFINDPAHRYVSLYSKFGMQAGWDADSSSEEWGLSHASGGPVSAMTVHKTATVPGGTADVAGEVISYSITIANVGNTTLTGLTVSDPSVSNLAGVLSAGFNVGDTNHDNNLSAGETWQYSASYTVTQADIDNVGANGEGFIINTVTADTTQTSPVSASASITVVRNSDIEVIKTADVSSVDAAGDVINYTVTVKNTGSTSLTGVVVNDPQFAVFTPIYGDQVLSPDPLLIPITSGDYNVGDTNQNGVQDPGETFQYGGILGDDNENGIQDPGETFQYQNVGDTNHNGVEDAGETYQYYNAGDTNHNGVEDPGETFQFLVNDEMPGVDADHDGFNDGDANEDGVLNIGETWVFAASYTVTQADIDNGGVFNPALTHDNTATATTHQTSESASASVAIDQNPHITVTKDATVPGGTADVVGELISYTISVTNDGNMTLTGLNVTDPGVSNLAAVISSGFNVGDADMDGKLDLGETWQYTASHTVTQADLDAGGTIDNTASATTAQGASGSDDASVTVAQNPHLSLDKSGTWQDGPEADGYADAGEQIHYTFAITNDGNVSLDNVAVSDALFGGTVTGPASGDTANVGVLDVGETWVFSADYTITAADVAAGTVHNEATATADGPQNQPASDTDAHDVTLPQEPNAVLMLTKTGLFVDTDENGVANVGGGDLIQYIFTVTNGGNVPLSSIELNDTILGGPIAGPDNGGDANNNNLLDVGEVWTWDEIYLLTAADVAAGSVENEATVTALDPSSQMLSAIAQWTTTLP